MNTASSDGKPGRMMMAITKTGKTADLLKREPPGEAFTPPPITRVEDTGLSALWLQDLTLKVLYFQGYLSGFKIADEIALPFGGVVDQILDVMKREKLVEVKSAQQIGLGEGSYV